VTRLVRVQPSPRSGQFPLGGTGSLASHPSASSMMQPSFRRPFSRFGEEYLCRLSERSPWRTSGVPYMPQARRPLEASTPTSAVAVTPPISAPAHATRLDSVAALRSSRSPHHLSSLTAISARPVPRLPLTVAGPVGAQLTGISACPSPGFGDHHPAPPRRQPALARPISLQRSSGTRSKLRRIATAPSSLHIG